MMRLNRIASAWLYNAAGYVSQLANSAIYRKLGTSAQRAIRRERISPKLNPDPSFIGRQIR